MGLEMSPGVGVGLGSGTRRASGGLQEGFEAGLETGAGQGSIWARSDTGLELHGREGQEGMGRGYREDGEGVELRGVVRQGCEVGWREFMGQSNGRGRGHGKRRGNRKV